MGPSVRLNLTILLPNISAKTAGDLDIQQNTEGPPHVFFMPRLVIPVQAVPQQNAFVQTSLKNIMYFSEAVQSTDLNQIDALHFKLNKRSLSVAYNRLSYLSTSPTPLGPCLIHTILLPPLIPLPLPILLFLHLAQLPNPYCFVLVFPLLSTILYFLQWQ